MLMRLETVGRRLGAIATIALIALSCSSGSNTSGDSAQVVKSPGVDSCGPIKKVSTAPATRGDSMHAVSKDALDFIVANKWCTTAAIPEYQDAQRFIGHGTVYGPVAQSISAPNLGNLLTHDAFDAQFVNVAIIDVAQDGGPLSQSYTRLHLQVGLNCVYLKHEHTGPTSHWSGKIAPPAANICDPATVAPILTAVAEHDGAQIPPVTRFVERSDMVPNIGVRCGTAWCVIGAGGPGDVPAAVHAGAPSTPPGAQSTIKGWFDDQHLAISNAASPHGLAPSIRASIVPEADLASKHLSDFSAGFVLVARAFFPGPATATLPAKYAAFGFTPGWNRIELKETGGTWQARITTPGGTSVLRVASRVEHTMFSVIAAARWAWRDTDEWIWVACDNGCCLIEPNAI